MQIRRREFIAGLGGAATRPFARPAAEAQRQVGTLPARVADDPTFEPIWRAFRQGLATFGWTEVRNLQIDYRISDFDPSRLAADAEELVNLRPDVMFAFMGQVARAVQQHRLTRVAGVYFANEEVNRDELRATIRAAAAQLEVTMIRMPVRDEVEIEHAITALAAEPDGSLLLNEANPLPIVEAIKRLASYVRQWSLPRKNLEPLRGVSMHSQSWHNIHEARYLGHDRFHVPSHDRGARTAHRLCLDHQRQSGITAS